jgi:hypothetical protein
LIVACIRNRFDRRYFSSINASQTFSQVIVIAVTIITIVKVVAALVSTLPATAVAVGRTPTPSRSLPFVACKHTDVANPWSLCPTSTSKSYVVG